jgi:hypothetical protein
MISDVQALGITYPHVFVYVNPVVDKEAADKRQVVVNKGLMSVPQLLDQLLDPAQFPDENNLASQLLSQANDPADVLARMYSGFQKQYTQ